MIDGILAANRLERAAAGHQRDHLWQVAEEVLALGAGPDVASQRRPVAVVPLRAGNAAAA